MRNLESFVQIVMEYSGAGWICSRDNASERENARGAGNKRNFERCYRGSPISVWSQQDTSCDIKGANMLLSADGRAKLADFGITRQLKVSSYVYLHGLTFIPASEERMPY